MRSSFGSYWLKTLLPLLLFIIVSRTATAQTTLAPGDIAFVGYITADDGTTGATQDDEFAFVLLKDIANGTVINFTDFGWLSTNAFQTANPCGANTGSINDGIIRWTANGSINSGTQIRIKCKYGLTATSGTVTGIQSCNNDANAYLSLAIGGDQLFAYQGTHTSPTLLAGISMNASWDASLDACFFSSNSSILPAALGASANTTAITSGINAKYNCTTSNGTAGILIAAINNSANWTTDNTFTPPIPVGFVLPVVCGFTTPAGPQISVGNAAGTITSCPGSPSTSPNLQQFTVSGSLLTGDIVITAPTNFEVSTSAGTGYGSSVTLTQSGGNVASTTIYVRSAATAPVGSISGLIQLASAGATTQNVSVTGTVNTIPAISYILTQPNNCNSNNGGAALTITGAAGPYTYFWTGAGIIQGQQNQSTLRVGAYTVVVTAANGCQGTASFTLVGPGDCPVCPTIGNISLNPTAPICTDASIAYTASGLLDMGATYGIQFKYSATSLADPYTGGTTLATVVNGSLTGGGTTATTNASIPTAGTYFIYAILSPAPADATCRPFQSTSLVVNPTPTAVATPASQPNCSGEAISTIVLSGAVSGTTYSWTRDNTVSVTGMAASGTGDISGTLTNTTSAPITVTFTITPSANGCLGTTTTATVLVKPTPTAVATPASQTKCSGEAISTIALSGALSGTTYSWTRDNTVSVTGIEANGTGDINGTLTNTSGAPVTVTFTITPTLNGCTGPSTTATVLVNPAPDATIVGENAQVCPGTTTQFSAPGIADVTYSWERSLSGLTSSFSTVGAGSTYGATTSGIYRFVATNGSTGCKATSDTNNVTVADLVFNGSLAAGDLQQTGRINRFGITSTCASPKACPGTFATTGSRYYDVYSVTNTQSVPVCATIGLKSFCGVNIFTAAYSGSFDPNSVCSNYLGDPGSSFPNIGYYEVTIPAGGTIQIVIHEVNPQTGCTGYRLSVELPRETPAIVAAPASISCGGSSTLTAGIANSYLWNTGATTTSITVSPLSTTSYSVTLGYGNIGCSKTISTTVSVLSTPPTVVCPGDLVLTNSLGSCGRIVNYSTTSAGTPAPVLTYAFTGATIASGNGDGSGSFFNKGVTTVTVTSTNACGSSNCSFTVTITDAEPPVITCPTAVTVSCAAAVPAVNIASVIATDNCPGVVVTHISDVISAQTCANRYAISRTYRATDAVGNFTDCTQTITVNDVTPPVITCPAAVTVSCAAAVPAPNTALVTATDNCAGGVTVVFVSDMISAQTCANRYTITRTYRATDVCGNSADCTQIITVNDVTPPVITCPAAVTVSCAAAVPAPNTALVTATDNCAGGVTVVFVSDVISAQTCANRYTITRTFRATDVCGNSADCTQTITVNDVTPPVITCPAAVTVSCAAAVPAPNTALVTATDNCAGGVTVVFVSDVISAQTCANRYTITRTYRATDVCGNSADCTQTITVNDVTPPVITCPVAVTVSCAAAVPAPNTALVTATDNCAGGVTVVFVSDVISAQTCANRYTITRTYRATDVCGNSADCTQTITVNDVTPPVITCPAAVTVSCAAAVPAPNTALVTATDNCAGGVTVVFVSDVISAQTCANRYTITRTYRATDVCGNSATCTQTIIVNDQTAPVLTCPANITTLTPVGSCNAVVNFTSAATDNCNGAVSIVSVPASGSVFPIGNTVVNVTATDACGNSSTCSFTVTVVDAQLPVISQQPVTRTVCRGSNATFTVSSTNAVSYQWQQWNGSTWINIPGATAASLTVNAVNFSQNTSTYRVAVIGLCTTVQSASASLYVNPLPEVSLTTSIPPFLLPGQVLNINASVNPNGGSYRWFLNGNVISGAVGNSINGITVDQLGAYRLTYTDLNGCVSTSADVVVASQASDNLWVYPNPTTGAFQVRIYNPTNEQIAVNLFDMKGARVLNNLPGVGGPYTSVQIQLGRQYADGVYVVQVVNRKGRVLAWKRVLVRQQ